MKKKEAPVVGKEIVLIDENLLKNKVYTIRGVKVMLDADLAEIYGYSTKDFNRQVKNNIERFPEIFRFQLTKVELENLRCKNCTSSWGGQRYLPYAFTEQGIYMLMTVLKGVLAVRQSMALICLFKEMKEYIISENQQLLGNTGIVQLAVQTERNTNDIKDIRHDLQKVMDNFIDPNTYKHYLIMNGQKLEADIAYTQIYSLAKKSIYVIDEYVSVKTLDLLRGVPEGLEIMIFSDRYVFIDYNEENEVLYHCGPSSKDAGNRVATVAILEFKDLYHPLMDKLLKEA